ncbi:MAG: glycosyltransferase [Candidatus Eisenbacteria bacterium]|uniref:Glycosyltransferase n=1 Tax=Eiseniibacteriota bacterium TaxID=2212470 RepID=A0A948RX79_UNCEI|nr:glycosyltransferase [Candidatus Eisenbacteria bacterium]MBU1947567.1 glycosyltransferase [Candidatus Eisenbacteria bacterium]MBU2692703.1 glycosyltransferase [Candidatus Eisenbacteria bacterium]
MTAELKDRDIICIAPSFWKTDAPLNVHHVMRRLAAQNRILFVESLGLRAPKHNRRDWGKVRDRIKGCLMGLRRTPEGLWLFSPLVLPFPGVGFIRRINRFYLIQALKWIMWRLDIQKPILWIFLPTGADLVGNLGECLVIYHCVDAYGENPGVNRGAINALEEKLLLHCDLLFTTSRPLFAEKIPQKGRSFFLQNVADISHFENPGMPPKELSSLEGPILGYVGNLADYKLDLELLLQMAGERPDWNICLVGPHGAGDPGTDLGQLEEQPNIHLMGSKDYSVIPSYIAGFDVCLIPFRLNSSTRSSFPLKFFEYMAAGKEIVTTPLEALKEYRSRPDLCHFAENAVEFIRAVEVALARSQVEELVEARRMEARKNSWELRIKEIHEIILQALEEFGGKPGEDPRGGRE